MNPPDVRTCTLAELHQFLEQWVEEQHAAASRS